MIAITREIPTTPKKGRGPEKGKDTATEKKAEIVETSLGKVFLLVQILQQPLLGFLKKLEFLRKLGLLTKSGFLGPPVMTLSTVQALFLGRMITALKGTIQRGSLESFQVAACLKMLLLLWKELCQERALKRHPSLCCSIMQYLSRRMQKVAVAVAPAQY